MTEHEIRQLRKENERLLQLLDIVLLHNKHLEQQLQRLAGGGTAADASFSSYAGASHIADSIFSSYDGDSIGAKNDSCSMADDNRGANFIFSSYDGAAGMPASVFSSHAGANDMAKNKNRYMAGDSIGAKLHSATSGSAGSEMNIKNDTYALDAAAANGASLPGASAADSSKNKNGEAAAAGTAAKNINVPLAAGKLQAIMQKASYASLDHTAVILLCLYQSPKQSMKHLQNLTGLSESGITKRIMSMKKYGLVARIRGKGLVVTEKTIRLLEASRV